MFYVAFEYFVLDCRAVLIHLCFIFKNSVIKLQTSVHQRLRGVLSCALGGVGLLPPLSIKTSSLAILVSYYCNTVISLIISISFCLSSYSYISFSFSFSALCLRFCSYLSSCRVLTTLSICSRYSLFCSLGLLSNLARLWLSFES